mmetsp:Transcript_42420/g.128210  ORF Transcript_42420/g.128210 Transcript_42420/m.128210 type:complete len:203 (-) Transcript_42420:228-836(-)
MLARRVRIAGAAASGHAAEPPHAVERGAGPEIANNDPAASVVVVAVRRTALEAPAPDQVLFIRVLHQALAELVVGLEGPLARRVAGENALFAGGALAAGRVGLLLVANVAEGQTRLVPCIWQVHRVPAIEEIEPLACHVVLRLRRWRVEAPPRGCEIVEFNRLSPENALVVRVHQVKLDDDAPRAAPPNGRYVQALARQLVR